MMFIMSIILLDIVAIPPVLRVSHVTRTGQVVPSVHDGAAGVLVTDLAGSFPDRSASDSRRRLSQHHPRPGGDRQSEWLVRQSPGPAGEGRVVQLQCWSGRD